MNGPIGRRGVVIEAAAAAFQRLAVVLLMIPVLGLSLAEVALRRDGKAYMVIARAFQTGIFSSIEDADRQYFLGYPALLGLIGKCVPLETAFIVIQVICAAVLAVLAMRLFRNEWTARWFVFCVPTIVLFSSLNMSEGLAAVLLLGIFLTYREKQFAVCAVLLGAALWVRPQNVFLLGAVLFLDLLFSPRRKSAVWFTVIPAAMAAGLLAVNQKVFGDAFINYHLYKSPEDRFMAFPILSLFERLQDPSFPLNHKIYVCAWIIFAAAGLVLLALKFLKKQTDLTEGLFLKWGILQFFFLLSLNSIWGVRELPRYLTVIFPAVLCGWEPFLPRKRGWIIAGAVLCVVFCLLVESSGNN